MTDAAFTPVLDAVRATGWTCAVLELDGVTGKSAFMDRCAGALRLPGWFGRNWDALADCLCDLSWLPVARGRLLLVSGWQGYAAAQPGEWHTAQRIFVEAETYWKERGEGFAVLLTVAAEHGPGGR